MCTAAGLPYHSDLTAGPLPGALGRGLGLGGSWGPAIPPKRCAAVADGWKGAAERSRREADAGLAAQPSLPDLHGASAQQGGCKAQWACPRHCADCGHCIQGHLARSRAPCSNGRHRSRSPPGLCACHRPHGVLSRSHTSCTCPGAVYCPPGAAGLAAVYHAQPAGAAVPCSRRRGPAAAAAERRGAQPTWQRRRRRQQPGAAEAASGGGPLDCQGPAHRHHHGSHLHHLWGALCWGRVQAAAAAAPAARVPLACCPMMPWHQLRHGCSSSIVRMHYCSAAHACSLPYCNTPVPAVELDTPPPSAAVAPHSPNDGPHHPNTTLAPPSIVLTSLFIPPVVIPMQVIYLALVSFLDMRGGELLPPPPEAYLP